MAKLTSKKVEGDFRRFLIDSDLARGLSGKVYRNGMRPRDSRKEDAVVIFTSGLPDEIQTGVITINIYVPDLDGNGTGVLEQDGQRLEEIERAAQDWVESLTAKRSCYRISLRQSIHTMEEPEINQHFVVVKLGYSYFDGE